LAPTSLGPTYETGVWNDIHGDRKSTARGKITAATMRESTGRKGIKLVVFYGDQQLLETPVKSEERVPEYATWLKELEVLNSESASNLTDAQRARKHRLEDLKKTEEARHERAQTTTLI